MALATTSTHYCVIHGGWFDGGRAMRGEDSICYPCADELAIAEMTTARYGEKEPYVFYISGDGKELTTWTGGKLGKVVHWGSLHPWSRERRYVTIRALDGRLWRGIGAAGMYAVIRLVKNASEA